VFLQFSEDQITWLAVGQQFGAEEYVNFATNDSVNYGVKLDRGSVNTTDVDVIFAASCNRFTGSGGGNRNWQSGTFWRLVKERAGVAVGFGAATATESGLVKGGKVPGDSTGTAIAIGNIGHTTNYTRTTAITVATTTPTVIKSFTGIKKGTFLFSMSVTGYCAAPYIAEFRFRKVTGAVLVKNQVQVIIASGATFNWAFPFVCEADQDYEITVHTSAGNSITLEGDAVNYSGAAYAGHFYDITRIG